MLQEVQYLKLPSKKYRMMAEATKLQYNTVGLPSKRQFVKVNVSEFVHEIKKRPILYNTLHQDYRRISMRNYAWGEVALAMNLSEQECKKRWRSMRDALLKTIRNKNEDERKAWIHYRLLEFMIPYLCFRKEEYEVLNDFSQRDENGDEIDYLGIDSDGEVYDGPITFSYVTQEGKEVFQVMHTPILKDLPEDAAVTEGITEQAFDEEEDHGEEYLSQPYNTVPNDGYLVAATTDEESDQELYEGQYDSRQLQIRTQSESEDEFLPDWNEEHLNDSTTMKENSEQMEESDCKRPKLESTSEAEVANDPPPQGSSRVLSPEPPPSPPTARPVTAATPPQREESKESDARLGITDPDERFLLSCAPILRRLPNKKNLLARLRIQQLLFELEYDEKYSYV
uniref:MADF domain-containing protein n=1 Tax=Anopheles dirus TaxID=7168 RepID=A0A182NF11_9DIPT